MNNRLSFPTLSKGSQPRRYHSEGREEKKDKGGGVKLPKLRMDRLLAKIGIGDKNKGMFVPRQDEQRRFIKNKWAQLKKQYQGGSKQLDSQPFESELDEIVIDCWQYGEKKGKRAVWKKYKDNYIQLTLDTMKAIRKW